MNTSAGSASLQRAAPQPAGATHRLQLMMRQRETLKSLFASAWDHLAARFQPDELEAWAAGVLDLADVNAGPSCLIAFCNLSKDQPTAEGVASLIAAAHAAADVCRHAGAGAATAAISAHPVARRMLGAEALPRWWRIMDELARQAPESVGAAAARMGQILATGSVDSFREFCRRRIESRVGRQSAAVKIFHARR